MKIQKTVRFRHFEFSLALGVFLILFQNCSQIGSIKVTPGTLSSESLSQITPVTETPSAINPVNPTIDPQIPAALAAGNVQTMPCTDRTSNFHEIRSAADFNYWAPLAESCNVFSLLNDIDFKGQELTPFYLNQSVFIGNNFKIFNYSIHYLVKKNQYNVSVGTFSTLQSSMIAGLKVSDFKIYVTQEDSDALPYQTASLVGNLDNSSIINSSASDGLIETVNNVWFIGGLVGRSCGNSEVHSSWSRVHINVKSSTNSPANAYNVSGLVGGFPCGNSVNIISNSFSSSTASDNTLTNYALKLSGTNGGLFSGLYIDKVYDNLNLQTPNQDSWDFSYIWISAGNSLPQLKENVFSQYKLAKFSSVPDPIQFDSCEKVSISMMDFSGNLFVPKTDLKFKMMTYGLIPYISATDCAQTINSISSLTILAGVSSTSFYVKTNLAVAPDWAATGVQLLLVNDLVSRSVLNLHVKIK